MTLGRERWIGFARRVQIQREVVRQFAVLENIVEQFFVPWAENHVVVLELRKFPVRPEVNQKERHAMAFFSHLPRFRLKCTFPAKKMRIRVHNVTVTHNGIKSREAAALKFQARNSSILCRNLVDLSV